jgi:hypothetical protein
MSDRHELERLLREPIDGLAAPGGAWEQIQKRSRRRRWVSASASVAAVMIIVAGAVPAVIAVRHNSDNATLSLDGSNKTSPNPKATTTSNPAPAPPAPLSGYFPESLSFVSGTTGFLWGSSGTSRTGVVARTDDAGAHWTELTAPPVNDGFLDAHGAAQIRFVNGDVGFLYGQKDLITTDAGASWRQFAAPGYIADLEAMNQKIWALVRPTATSHDVRLYSATAIDPQLKLVKAVPVMRSMPGAPEVAGGASIAVSGDRVDVIAGSSSFYSSSNGKRWVSRRNPCQAQVNGAPVHTALVTSTDTLGVAVACGYDVQAKSETKQLYISPDSGGRWQALPTQPTSFGLLQTFSAGSVSDLVIGTTWGGAAITHDGGRSWAATTAPGGALLSFVGFIDVSHIVGVADRASSGAGAFANSTDAGHNWTLTRFAPAS